MQSMTGYGRCRVCADGRELTLELKAVNHRFLDITFRLPKNLAFLEDSLRTRINQSNLRRGHVDVFVTYQNTRTDARVVNIDAGLLEAFNAAMKTVHKSLDDFRRASAAEVLTLSGALSVAQADEDTEAVTVLAQQAFDGAVEALIAMRDREGAHLAEDLLSNLKELASLREKIAERAPSVPEEYRTRLTARLEEWQVNAVDPQRVAQEVAIMADRCAIDEELSRLEGHIVQFTDSVQNGTEVGRKLDFLLQEMNREVNTTGSKASDALITQAVVDAKCIIEKLREQVQNAV
ncbi:MAG: YicC family protein [Clostridia bacterium]|nr:YicC family protein [Clostridia bacterium]